MSDHNLHSRRDFLRYSAVLSAGMVIPAFLSETASTVVGQQPRHADPAPAARRQPISGFKDDRILVVIQLGGGNDGLNCLPPYADDAYYRARRVVNIPRPTVIKLDDYFGFHPAMTALKALYDDGKVAVINGVGYPNPNRSHFRSMDIWHSASDADRYEKDGWLGRYFHNCCEGHSNTTAGIQFGSELAPAFLGSPLGVAFDDPARFRWEAGFGLDTETAFKAVNRLDNQAGSNPEAHSLDFLRHVTANIVMSSSQVRDASNLRRQTPDYPTGGRGRLGAALRQVAGLIAANMPTRIYYLAVGGFDTHANQLNAHQNLLAAFSEGVSAFYKDLKMNGQADRVVMMAFSEFGRRVQENASNGTDHGTAGPMFLIGDGVNPGCHGHYPSLTQLERNGDLVHNVDFRSVYATVLENWFDVRHAPVLRKRFPTLNLIR